MTELWGAFQNTVRGVAGPEWGDEAWLVAKSVAGIVMVLVPLLIVLLGTGFVFRATIVFLATVWYVTLATYQGARGIDPRMLAAARSYGAGGWQTFWLVILPALFPFLLTGARVGLVHAIRAMVMAEMYVLVGFGGLLHQTGLSTSTDRTAAPDRSVDVDSPVAVLPAAAHGRKHRRDRRAATGGETAGSVV